MLTWRGLEVTPPYSMSVTSDTVVIIPALDEAESITNVVSGIKSAADSDVIVIDDNSADDTANLARAAGAFVISLSAGLGAWGATQAGLRFSMSKGYSIFVTMDADGQHRAESIKDLIAPIHEKRSNFTIGTYPERGSRSRLVAWSLLRSLSGLAHTDLTSGLRAYDRQAAALLASKVASHYEYQDVGVLALLKKHRLVGEEVAVKMNSRTHGKSRIFSTWSLVLSYMAYSILLSVSKRGSFRNLSSGNRAPAERVR